MKQVRTQSPLEPSQLHYSRHETFTAERGPSQSFIPAPEIKHTRAEQTHKRPRLRLIAIRRTVILPRESICSRKSTAGCGFYLLTHSLQPAAMGEDV